MSICRKKGHGDHAVIGIFAVMSVAGAAAAIAFLIYSGKSFHIEICWEVVCLAIRGPRRERDGA